MLNLIPGGTYFMGSNARTDEQPVHKVTIKPLLIGRFELRQSCWNKVAETSKKVGAANEPVHSVSFADCQAWLREAGSDLRLPSEAEWEYACRSSSTTSYFWGDTINSDYLWFNENKNLRGKQSAVTSHFQSKKWNAFGLVDMSGNVWEWCQDEWVGNYNQGPSNSQHRSGDPRLRVARGGSWLATATDCRSARRGNFAVAARDSSLGFRVAKSLD